MKKNKHLRSFLCALIAVGVIVSALGIVLLVDSLTNRASAEISVEEAQKKLDDTLDGLPNNVAFAAKEIRKNTTVTVNELDYGSERDIVLKCTYKTIDFYSIIENNIDDLLNVQIQDEKTGKTKNATEIMLNDILPKIQTLIPTAETVEGEVDIYLYDTQDEGLQFYLSDETVDTVFGGVLRAKTLVENTKTITVDGNEVDISTRNSLRSGCIDCFKLSNYESAKPDTSTPIRKAFNTFKSDFYKNFIEENRWVYLVKGLGNTLAITALALILGVVIGILVAAIRCTYAKTGRFKILDAVCKVYLSIMRGTPVMIQLLIIYFVLLLPIGVSKFLAAVLCFGINSGAYVSEIMRGGIMAIDEGQSEAGRSLGLGYTATMWHIVIPQAFKAILPSLANEFIALLKETSVAFYIGVADLTQGGLKIRSITYSNFMPLIAIALIYLVLVLGLSYLVSLLERRLRKSER